MTAPFRFGLEVAGSGYDAASWKGLAREAEGRGYASLLLPDHAYDMLAPVPAMMAAADATETLVVGTSVLANEMRHPAVLARDLATVSALSGGRLEVGLGAGWHQAEYAAMGIPLPDARTRIERLAESVLLLRRLLTGEPTSSDGQHYPVSGLQVHPRLDPAARPRFLIGGGGPRVLACAARHADIVGLNSNLGNGRTAKGSAVMATATADSTRSKIAWIRDAAGSRFGELELSTRVYRTNVGPGARSAEDIAAEVSMAPPDVERSPHMLVGDVTRVVEKVERIRSEFGISYVVVTGLALRSFAPVVARLAGT